MDNVIQLPVGANENDLVLITPGNYTAVYNSHKIARSFAGKLVVFYRIIEPGAAFEKIVPAWYQVRVIDPKKCSFSVRPLSKFARDWRVVFRHSPSRWDRIPMTALKGVLVTLGVRTVTTDHRQKRLDPMYHNSVIAQMLRRAEM